MNKEETNIVQLIYGIIPVSSFHRLITYHSVNKNEIFFTDESGKINIKKITKPEQIKKLKTEQEIFCKKLTENKGRSFENVESIHFTEDNKKHVYICKYTNNDDTLLKVDIPVQDGLPKWQIAEINISKDKDCTIELLTEYKESLVDKHYQKKINHGSKFEPEVLDTGINISELERFIKNIKSSKQEMD